MSDALIVGAGPVGLALALELARRGRMPRIIDKATSPAEASRAIGINPRTLDILEASGASARMLAEGLRINRARLVARGRMIGTIEFNRLNHRHPFMTALPQMRTEEILAELLAQRGIAVERGVSFQGYEVHGGKAHCRLTGAREEEYACDLLLGCDGARSTVRQAAGIAFEGRAYEHDWSLMDAELDWPFAPDEVVLIMGEQGTLFTIPLGPSVYRLVRNGDRPEALLPPDAKLGRVLWRSRFRISHKLAQRFQADQVFLAGDAAHIHSPAGARGMNGGIEDAATLAWLIASGRAEEYEGLRRPAARRVLAQVDRQTRQADVKGGVFLDLRAAIAALALRIGFVQRYGARFITALDTPPPAWL